jgi:hypothetical protein
MDILKGGGLALTGPDYQDNEPVVKLGRFFV